MLGSSFAKTISFLAILIASLALPACGGESARAREYMLAADDMLVGIEEQADCLEEGAQQLVHDLTRGLIPTGGDYSSRARHVEQIAVALESEISMARSEYEKLLDLSGVSRYKEYAELRIAALDNALDMLKELDALLQGMEEDFVDDLAHDMGSSLDRIDAWAEANQDMVEMGKGLSEKAEKLKEEKKL